MWDESGSGVGWVSRIAVLDWQTFFAGKIASMSSYLFTSESVSEGHPDKVADQISDAVLDAILAQDKTSRVAAETLVKDNMVVLAGEITTGARVNFSEVVRKTIKRIGYNDPTIGFDTHTCTVIVAYGEQSPGHRAGRRRRQGPRPRPGRGRPGPDVRLRLRRDAAAHAAPDLSRRIGWSSASRRSAATAACPGCARTPSPRSPSSMWTTSPMRSRRWCCPPSTNRASPTSRSRKR